MRLDRADDEVVQVTLSERNLLALLEKLTWDSKRTLTIPCDDGKTLIVQVESNEIHYANRSAPGPCIDNQGRSY